MRNSGNVVPLATLDLSPFSCLRCLEFLEIVNRGPNGYQLGSSQLSQLALLTRLRALKCPITAAAQGCFDMAKLEAGVLHLRALGCLVYLDLGPDLTATVIARMSDGLMPHVVAARRADRTIADLNEKRCLSGL